MKTKIIIIMLFICATIQAQYKVDNTSPAISGLYTGFTNTSPVIIGTDTIKAGGLRYSLKYLFSGNDTGISVNKIIPKQYGKYTNIINKNGIILGNDTVVKNGITAELIYILNGNLSYSDKPNNFSATQYFQKLVVDTMIINEIDSSKSFKAGNILINGVDNKIKGIDILYANIISANGSGYFGSIILNASTKTISGVDSVKADKYLQVGSNIRLSEGMLQLNSGSQYANSSLYWASSSGYIQAWNDSRLKSFKPFRFDTSYVYIDSILTVSKSINTKSITADTLKLNNSKIYDGGGYLQLSAYTTIANKYVFNSDAFTSLNNNTLDLGYPSATWRNLYLGTCLYSPTIKLTNTSEPSNPSAGTVYYNSSDNHYYGYNGTIWKQLDN
jgi:hypothetical protein